MSFSRGHRFGKSLGAFLAIACLASLTVGGCGGTASRDELAQAEKHARRLKTEKEKERRLERKLALLERENRLAKKHRRQKAKQQRKAIEKAHVEPTTPESAPAPSAPATPSGTDCGGGVIAGPETSCGFAINTKSAYEAEVGGGSGTVEAYSEANDEIYAMYCTEGSEHECSGAISATVYWP